MPTISRSHASRGRAYYKHTGGYNEVTIEAIDDVNNDASKATKQKNLAKKGKNSAAAKTTNNVVKELDL